MFNYSKTRREENVLHFFFTNDSIFFVFIHQSFHWLRKRFGVIAQKTTAKSKDECTFCSLCFVISEYFCRLLPIIDHIYWKSRVINKINANKCDYRISYRSLNFTFPITQVCVYLVKTLALCWKTVKFLVYLTSIYLVILSLKEIKSGSVFS